MLDRYGRNIDYLRISLTDRCNLRCIYCMPEEGIRQIPRTELLDTDEIVRICKAASELGISSFFKSSPKYNTFMPKQILLSKETFGFSC